MDNIRTYTASDMAKIFCEKCNGCGGCCHGMTDTIHLDPYDVDQLAKGLHKDPAALIHHEIELQNEDGLILPYLNMIPDPDWRPGSSSGSMPSDFRERQMQNVPSAQPADSSSVSAAARNAAAAMGYQIQENWEGTRAAADPQRNPGVCRFLGQDGRCSIHEFRPGYCRLFPLGRDYDAETKTFRYFIVDNGCPMPGKMKVRISRWLGVPDLARYEKYVSDWHYFCRDAREKIRTQAADPAQGAADYVQQLNAFILKVFYLVPYDASRDFYTLFDMRLQQARSVLS